jgi:hypothetical protein
MRVLFPEGKVAEKRPDLWAVVHGDFADAKGNPLTVTRKEITTEMAQAKDFVLDYSKGILNIPTGKRGRKATAGATPEEIAKRLSALKG